MAAKLDTDRSGASLGTTKHDYRRDRATVLARGRERTVMFTDIAGFTQLAESLPPTWIARLLRGHFRLLAHCIEAEQGRIDKVMGDGLVAVWGETALHGPACAPALRAAVAIRTAVESDNAYRLRRGQLPISLRIGLHVGPLIATPLGAAGRLGIVLCGDTVNVAQRLEDAGRDVDSELAVTIVASEAVVARAGPGFRFVELGNLPVRGRREPVAAFELAALDECPQGGLRPATA